MPNYLKLLNIAAEHIKKTDDFVCVAFTVPSSLPWFDGHFPGQPVLPAVITAEISDALIENIYKVSPKHVINAKFKGPIFPDMNLNVTLQKLNEDSVNIVWKKADESGSDQFLADMKFRI